jgi:hypothetical protein
MNIYDKVGRLGWYSLLEGTDRQSNGNTWFVNGNSGNAANSADVGQGASWDAPFATVNYAISRCSNNAGDIIIVAASHTETIADTNDSNVSGTVTDEFCVDKSGVTIIGLGSGTRRPTFTLASATDACIDVRAANCTLCNLVFYNTIADNVAMLDAQSTASGLTIENCKFYESAANAEAILQINLTANCDDVTIRGCRFYNVDTNDGGLASIKLEGGSDRLRLIDNVFDGDWNEQIIDADTALSTEVEIIGNVFNNVDAVVCSAIDLHSSSTGIVSNNIIHNCAGGSGGGPISAVGCLVSGNRVAVNEGQNAVEFPGTVGGTKIGNHWYVDSGTGADTNSGTSWADAVATVDTAIGLATASNGDIIHVAAGHAESDMDGTAGQIFDMDKIGISVVGEGSGDARPTFTFTTDTANANVDVTAADCRLENLIFACNVASQAYMVYAHTSADDLIIRNCEFREGGQQPLSAILLGGGDGHADRVIIDNNRIYLPTAGPQDNAIEILYDMTGVEITNNYIMGNFDEAAIEIPAGGNNCQDMIIKNNIIINEQTGIHCIEVEQTALTVTGVCANNILVNDSRGICLRPNILSCYGNIWMPLGGNARPVILEGELTTPGQNFYVDSGHGEAVDDTAHGSSWDFPCATIDYAIALCTANNGDTIHVAPGHEETLDNTHAITIDVVGVTLIGYGKGSDKPLITYDHADGEIAVTVDNFTMKNFRLRPSTDGVTNAIILSAGADNFTIEDCEFGFPETASDEFAKAIISGDASNNMTVNNCKFMAGACAAVAAIDLTTDTDHTVISNCLFTGAYSTAPIMGQTTASTNLDIHHNKFLCTGSTDTFNLVASSTGFVRDNYISVNAATFADALDIGDCFNVNNFMIADADVGGACCDNRYTAAASVTETLDG